MAKLPATDSIRVGVNGNSPMKRMKDHPDHYQSLLADLIRKEKPEVMIETGVESGYSSEHFIMAMEDNHKGHLYSCDPAPSGFYEAYPIVHPRFTFIQKRSYEALDEIFRKTRRLDMFLHDNDHSFDCQSWEFNWAWNHVRPGGIIASDDTMWSDTDPAHPHRAWEKFLESHGLINMRNKINNGEWIRRP